MLPEESGTSSTSDCSEVVSMSFLATHLALFPFTVEFNLGRTGRFWHFRRWSTNLISYVRKRWTEEVSKSTSQRIGTTNRCKCLLEFGIEIKVKFLPQVYPPKPAITVEEHGNYLIWKLLEMCTKRHLKIVKKENEIEKDRTKCWQEEKSIPYGKKENVKVTAERIRKR